LSPPLRRSSPPEERARRRADPPAPGGPVRGVIVPAPEKPVRDFIVPVGDCSCCYVALISCRARAGPSRLPSPVVQVFAAWPVRRRRFPAPRELQRLAVVGVSHPCLAAAQVGHWQVSCVAPVAVGHRERAVMPGKIQQRVHRHALPDRAELGPPSDAMDVDGHVLARRLLLAAAADGKLQRSRAVCGVGPTDKTGKSLVRYWPGGTRPAVSAGPGCLRWNPRETGLIPAILSSGPAAALAPPLLGTGHRADLLSRTGLGRYHLSLHVTG
jgi:hypothetical protein